MTMKVTVMLSSGDEDVWEDAGAEMSMDLGGALIVTDDAPEGQPSTVVAIYAPGMWMKAEFES
jgi:hypothetical protein